MWNVFPSCSNLVPTTIGNAVHADPALIKVSSTGNIIWTINLNESFGIDFENDLIIDFNTNVALVLGVTNNDVSPSPTEQKPVVSKVNINSGAIIYEKAFMNNTNSQWMYCPFVIQFDGTGSALIGGDANGSISFGEYYEILNFTY